MFRGFNTLTLSFPHAFSPFLYLNLSPSMLSISFSSSSLLPPLGCRGVCVCVCVCRGVCGGVRVYVWEELRGSRKAPPPYIYISSSIFLFIFLHHFQRKCQYLVESWVYHSCDIIEDGCTAAVTLGRLG